jgi:hypothetical protein
MPSRPTILAALSLPVGAIAYTVGAAIISALDPPGGAFLVLLLPLFLAGLVMMPLLIPFFDRKAKQDLAAYRSQQAADGDGQDASELTDATVAADDPEAPGRIDGDDTGGTNR